MRTYFNLLKNNSDAARLFIFSLFILVRLFTEVLVAFLGENRQLTIIVYAILLLVTVRCVYKSINFHDVTLLLMIYVIFLLSFLIFPETREYYMNQEMFLVLFLYIPISVFVIRKISDWDLMYVVFRPFCIVGTVFSALIILFADISSYEKLFSYMEFSYFTLPIAIFSFLTYVKNKNILFLICSLICGGCMLIYSSRAAVSSLILFVVIIQLIIPGAKTIKTVVVLSIVFVAFLFLYYMDDIVSGLLSSDLFGQSRFLNILSNEELFVSRGRDEIDIYCARRMNSVGIQISGFFGDRAYLGSWPYPHDIGKELVMSWGWLVGGVMCVSLIVQMYKAVFKSKYREIALFLIFAFFMRYLFSGSYLTEGAFFWYLFAMSSINVNSKRQTDRLLR